MRFPSTQLEFNHGISYVTGNRESTRSALSRNDVLLTKTLRFKWLGKQVRLALFLFLALRNAHIRIL